MPDPYYSADGVTLHLGDSLNILPTLADASVDAVVCDPPYGLTELSATTVLQAIAAWMGGDRNHVPDGRGFMGRDWDRFVPPPGIWDECLRVLKPGGHLVAFAGSRTVDLMGLSIRIAGFEIRDGLQWIYGSGFPKSLDVSKAIDKAGGASPQQQAIVLRAARERAGLSREQVAEVVGCSTSSVRDWEEGRARARGRDVEYLVPSAGYRERLADLLGYTADERAIMGSTADRRGDGTVIGLGHTGTQYGNPSTELARQWQGWGTALKPAHEPIILARKPLAGTVSATVLQHGTGALNIDGCRTAAGQDYRDKCASVVGIDSPRNKDAYGESTGAREDSAHAAGRWPTNILLGHGPDCAGTCSPGCPVPELGAEARFFPVFRYEAKAPASERPRLADGTAWPTVKPVALMRWLIRLITPPGGTVLDWCAGSGTTLEAARLEDFPVIGVERDRVAAELCRVRLEKPYSVALFGDIA